MLAIVIKAGGTIPDFLMDSFQLTIAFKLEKSVSIQVSLSPDKLES